jgi:hypothetical protein
MTRHERNQPRRIAMGEGNPGLCCASQGGGDARHDFVSNAGAVQCLGFFAAAAEDKRISALQTHDFLAVVRKLYQQRIDLSLRDAMPSPGLTDEHPFRIAACEVEHFIGDETVVHDNVRFTEQALSTER